MLSKEQIRDDIAAQFEPKREKLGEHFDQFVEEISEIRFEYLTKRDSLPKPPPGMLDGNPEGGRLLREEGLKWVMIKQKYGI